MLAFCATAVPASAAAPTLLPGSAGGFETAWAIPGGNLADVAVDSAGNVYVTVEDPLDPRVEVYEPDGDFVRRFSTVVSPDFNSIQMVSVAVDRAGNVYVLDAGNHRVQKYGPSGDLITSWGSRGVTDGQFVRPTGLAVDGDGNVFVSQLGGLAGSGLAPPQVQKFDASGAFVTKWGSYGSAPGQFQDPLDVAVDTHGDVYVIENHGVIQRFDSSGAFVTAWGEFGSADGYMHSPKGIGVDPADNVYATDANNGIQKWNSIGTFAARWGDTAFDDRGIAVDSRGRAFVVDTVNQRILRFGATTLAYRENDVTPVDPFVDVIDADSAELTGATVAVTANHAPGEDELRFTDQNGITGTFAPGTGELSLAGLASLADYETALRSVAYANSSETPSEATRSITFTADDGAEGSAPISRNVSVEALPEKPLLTGTGTTAYAEGEAAVDVAPAIAISDGDGTELESARIELTDPGPGDELLFATTNGLADADPSANAIELAGVKSLAEYEAALRAVRFRNPTNDPRPADRHVTFEVGDGELVSDEVTQTIDVTEANEAPTLTGSGGGLTYTENDAATVVDPILDVSDPDSGGRLASATVTLSANFQGGGEDALVSDEQDGIAASFDTGTGALTLHGNATFAEYETVLRSVRYANFSDAPSPSTRTVVFAVDDGDDSSNEVSRTIAVTSVNDLPEVVPRPHPCSGCPAATWDYPEQAPATRVANSVIVSDPDDTEIESARIEFTDPQPGDELLYTTTNGLADGDPAANVIELSGTRTHIEYMQALRAAQFQSTSDNPSSADRHFSFVVNDGSDASPAGPMTIRVQPANDVATLEGTATDLAYTENGPATAVDPGVTVADPDDLQQDAAEVRILDPRPGDELDYATTNGVEATINGPKDTVTLANGDDADVEAALRAVTFRSTSDDPSAADRHVASFAYDGGGNSNVVQRTINVAPVNDAPGVTATATTLDYVENDPATAVDPGLALADPDDTDFDSAEVELTDPQPGDELSYATTNGVAGTVNAVKDTVTFSGAHSKSDYEAALGAVRYRYPREDPSLADRTVSFAVNDGDAGSAPATRSISLAARPPSNAVAPALSGRARQGSTLSATEGVWQGTRPIGFAHRWQRCSAAGGGCADIAGANGRDYVAQAGDVGGRVRVVVTADNPAAGTAEQASEPSLLIRAGIASPSIDESPPADTQASDARFAFSGEEGASFECSLDGAGFESCGSPVELTGLAVGEHRFAVRQSTDDGLVSEPTSHTWRIAAADDVPRGTPGADRLVGTPGADSLFGLEGDDWILGRQGDDRLVGGPGADHLNGARGDDVVKGNDGPDVLIGGPGSDEIDGNGGRDSIDASDGDRDEISCGSGGDRVEADGKDDVDRSCERVSRKGRR